MIQGQTLHSVLSDTVRVFGLCKQHGPAVVELFDKVGILQFRFLGDGFHDSNVTRD